MQEAGFLNKLYQIKPFKIVESPQNPKRLPQRVSITQTPYPSHYPITMMPLLQVPNSMSQSSSKPSSSTHKQNVVINLTPNKNCNKIQIQLRGSNQKSSDKFVRKYSIQQPCSPITSNNLQKCYSISQNPDIILNTVPNSPSKTPNKQNILPIGTMIQSHLYTSLSSSIDTLFTKIQKIKQEFQTTNNPDGSDQVSLQNNKAGENKKQKKGCRDGQYKMINHQNCSQISGHSPILKSKMSKQNEISSMSSFSPMLPNKVDKPILQINKQQNKSHGKNKNYINNICKQNFPKEIQSIQSFEPVIVGLPATHTQNINQMSNKTKSIIDQINLLLQSNKKNNPYRQKQKLQKQKNNCKLNRQYLRKVQTLQYQDEGYNEPNDCQQYKNKNNQKENIQCHQYDQLDDQFITIKLKPMQSQYAPQTLQKVNSTNNSVNSCQQNKKKGNCLKLQTKISNINFNYKIQQPNFINQKQKEYVRNGISQNISDSQTIIKGNLQLSMRDFQLGKCVGSGKFGDVHICKHKASGFIFALKKIFKSTILQYGMINQFIQELKIHYKLSNNHPNITKLYTHFQDQYHIFLLMEYIQDGTLMNHLKKQEEFVSNIVLQVLNAVEYLHRNNIAHRDIKPENILYTNGVAKVCDFGWSSQFKDEMKKTFCGTLDYVSPQMKDRGQYTTTVDLWSIGVLTFELLTGFPPYKKQIDRWRIMGSKLQDRWRWDVIFPPQISYSARNFMQKLLKQNPDERISIRECRQQEFITKFNKKQSEASLILGKEILKILQ